MERGAEREEEEEEEERIKGTVAESGLAPISRAIPDKEFSIFESSCENHRALSLFLSFLFFDHQRSLNSPVCGKMTTLLPPPTKRQRTEASEKTRQQQEIESIPADLGSVRVQFFDQATGSATGPAVSVPVADANVKNLETLLNTLQGNVSTVDVLRIATKLTSFSFSLSPRTTMSEYRIGSHTSPTIKTNRQLISRQICIILCSSPA